MLCERRLLILSNSFLRLCSKKWSKLSNSECYSVKGCVMISTNHCGGNFLHCSPPPAAAAQFNNNTPRIQQQQEQQKRAQAAFNTVHQLSAAVCGVSAGYYCYWELLASSTKCESFRLLLASLLLKLWFFIHWPPSNSFPSVIIIQRNKSFLVKINGVKIIWKFRQMAIRPSKATKGSVTDFCGVKKYWSITNKKHNTQQCRLSATIGMKSPRPI